MNFHEYISQLEKSFDIEPPTQVLDFFPKLKDTKVSTSNGWNEFLTSVMDIMSTNQKSVVADEKLKKLIPYYNTDRSGTINLIAYILKNKKKKYTPDVFDNMIELWDQVLKNKTLSVLDLDPDPEAN